MKRLIWPMVIGISSILFILTIGLNVQSPLRGLLTFWFLLVCPGMAFIRLLNLKEAIFEWVLAVALSMALGMIFSEAAVLNQRWSPEAVSILLASLSLFGAILQVIAVFRSLKPKRVTQ
jgi:uncharacterized membrane protein